MSLKTTIINIAQKNLSTIEHVRNIFQFLNFKEQYKLSQCSETLRHIATEGIWKTNLDEVEILICSADQFLVINGINDTGSKIFDGMNYFEFVDIYNKMATTVEHLNKEELDIFFNLNKENIKKLKIKDNSRNAAVFPLTQEFKNLKYLELYKFHITNSEMKYVANKCKNIESLILLKCYSNYFTHVLDNDEMLQIIATLQNLKNLEITPPYFKFWQFKDLVKIVNALKLQQLSYNCSIPTLLEVEELELNVGKLKDYTEFKIGEMTNYETILYFQRNFLTNFENLGKLCLKDEAIGRDFFNISLKSIRNLTHLQLICCDMADFQPLPALKEIFFNSCYSLTYRDLKIMLNEMNLKSFTAFETNFSGDFNTFSISPTLENFAIAKASKNTKINIRKLFESNKLEKLRKFCFPHVNPQICLEFAPNVQDLFISPSSVNIYNFFKLNYLRKVFITNCYSRELFKISQMMTHQNLIEFSIKNYILPEDDNPINLRRIGTVRTNLLNFNIPDNMMKVETNFVLDLLNVNKNLSLKCNIKKYSEESKLIPEILLNEKFPKRFKHINIYGSLFDCSNIRKKPSEHYDVMKLFKGPYYLSYFILE